MEILRQTTVICDDIRIKPDPETIEKWNSMNDENKCRFIIAFPQYVIYIYNLTEEIKEKFIRIHPAFERYI